MMIKKGWCKIPVSFSCVFKIFFGNSIRFLSSATKIFNVILAIINTKKISNIPEENFFAPLRILNFFIKSFVNRFVDIALTFFSSFNSFLFQSAFFTKLVISFLLTKFTCANLAVKFSALNFLNSWVVIYLSWLWSVVTLFPMSSFVL